MMIFNWNDQDQAVDTMWPDFTSSENHIVPFHMETEADALFSSKNYKKSKRDEGTISNPRLTEQSNEAKYNNLSNKSGSGSDFNTNEEPSSSSAEIDSWLNYSNFCMDLEDKYQDRENHNSMTELMNDITDANNLNSAEGDSMQHPDLIGHDSRLNEDFLNSDWASFRDFDDIEKIFRKEESVFGHEMIDSAEGFLSQSNDVIDSTAQSIPMPDLPLCRDQTPDDGCCSFLLDDHSEEHESPLQKAKVDEQKINLLSEKRAKGRGKNKLPSLYDIHSENQLSPNSTSLSSITDPMQFQSNMIAPPMHLFESKLLEHHITPNHVSLIKHAYPASPLFQIDGNQKRHVFSNKVPLIDAKHPKNSYSLPESKLSIMTPQEKMEKLRRLQKMQAQLAIEQQHQQYSHQICPIDESACKVLSSEQDESRTIYYQLQKTVEKLDMRTRFCIRDSLLRLAKSAAERQGSGDKSSENKSNIDEDEMIAGPEFRNHDRASMLGDTEADTNPLDRVVANLLFQRPTETFRRLRPCSPFSST